MTAPTAAIELDPVWRAFRDAPYSLARMEMLASTRGASPNVWTLGGNVRALANATSADRPYLNLLSYGAVAARPAKTGDRVERFPSVVEIDWYGQFAPLGINQAGFAIAPRRPEEGLGGQGALVTQEAAMLMPRAAALIGEISSLGLRPLPRPNQTNYLLACIGWGELAVNVVSQMSQAAVSVNYDVFSINAVAVESMGLPADCAAAISTPVHSGLAKRIRAVYENTELDEDAVGSTRRAVNDAIRFVDFSLPRGEPLVMLSDDGVLSLQWRLGNRGVMLVFTGDGTGTYSIKEPEGSYAVGAKDFRLEDGLIEEVKAAIDSRAAA
jgi:hypothetical protein